MQERTARQYAAVSGLLKNMAEVSAQKAKIPKMEFEMTAMRCLSFESFRHYTSIVASRAMVISGEKHLTPLADMPNYEPKNDGRVMANGQDFMKYHVLGDDGSMTVKSDRDFGSGQQVFEVRSYEERSDDNEKRRGCGARATKICRFRDSARFARRSLRTF